MSISDCNGSSPLAFDLIHLGRDTPGHGYLESGPVALVGRMVWQAKKGVRDCLLDLVQRLIYDPLTDCNLPIQTSWVSK